MLDIPLVTLIDGAVDMVTKLVHSKTEVRKFYSTNRRVLSSHIEVNSKRI